jgi:hypothetical protein
MAAGKVNGKNKGNTFERKIANLLSDRFKEHLGIEKGFRRNPDSGSFFGGQNQSRTETYGSEFAIYGDLICPKTFQYSIECKHYKSAPSFQSVINADVKQWDGWLEQAVQDAKNSNKKMLMIVKYNNVDELVFVDEPQALELRLTYCGRYVYKLSDFLGLDNTTFFI